MTTRRLLLGLLLFCLAPAAAVGQVDIAKRTLDSGISFFRSGDWRQAVQDFTTVINGYGDSEWVDEALIYLARYHWEVEGDLEEARSALLRIQRDHAASNSTPASYFYLGSFLSASRTSDEQMRDGLANFERVVRLFPESELADDALLQAARVTKALGDYDTALERLNTLLGLYPDSELADEAQFELGNCFMLLDEMRQAMVEYQQLRNRYPDSDLAERALDRLTLLYRLHFSSEAGREPFNRDSEFRLLPSRQLDDPVYLELSPGGQLYLADRGEEDMIVFDLQGRQVSRTKMRQPQMVKFGPGGEPTYLADRYLREEQPLSLVYRSADGRREMRDVFAFCRGPRGEYIIWDRGSNDIFVFSAEGEQIRAHTTYILPDVVDIVASQEGYVYILDRRERKIMILDENGNQVRTLGPRIGGRELRDPVYMELDEAGNLYVLDRDLRSVLIFTGEGSLLAALSYGEAIRDPRGLAVEPSGAVIIIDRRQRNAVRFE